MQTIIYRIVLLYSTGNYIHYPVTNHHGKEYEIYIYTYIYIYIYIYIYLNHCISELCYTAEINTAL